MQFFRQLFTVLFLPALVLMMLTPDKARAQEPVQLSLEQAIKHALEYNYELNNAKADASIASRQVWEITASGLPQVSGTVGYQYFTDIPTSLVPAEFFGGEEGEFAEIQFGTEQNLTATLSVNQLIFDGSYIIGLRAARIFRELSLQSYQRSEIEVKSSVMESYYLSLATSQNVEIMSGNLSNLEKTLYETEKLFEQGFTDAINVDQLKLTVANLKNSISGMARQKKLTLDLLKFQIGIDVSREVILTESLEDLFAAISLEAISVQEFNPQNHIDFRIMQSQEQMQLMSMRREWSFYLPTISAFYTRQENAYRNEFNFFQGSQPWFPTSILGVNINIPIFSSGERHSRVQQARLELDKAKNNTRMVEQSLLLQKQEASNNIQTAMEQYNTEKDNLALARRILDRTTIMYREGLASSLELTQASDQLLTTQANYINAMFEMLNASNRLKKALGRF
ncbi:MAG: TolC family protein [Bacteroidetes bacterium]|nr:MAG: TolC family protein [Bacteroidota bacterium]